jgi:hypothetical protein
MRVHILKNRGYMPEIYIKNEKYINKKGGVIKK